MAGIVFGCIVPHPPLLVPDIGRGQEAAISATTQAMEKLADKLAGQHPDTILVISPHGQDYDDAMGILTATSSTGDLRSWGVVGPRQHFGNDLKMVALIQKEAGADGIQIKSIGESGYELDHGVMVPMHFLLSGVKGVPVTTIHLGPYLSVTQPVIGASNPPSNRPILAATDVAARLKPSSEDIGLNSAENP